MPEPTEQIWKESAEKFNNMWQFPNCIGSIDGKHVTIKCPDNTGSQHFCYLKKFSVVLMAIVGADYKFLCVDIGAYGKNSDGGIFERSAMGHKFEAETFNVPKKKPLSENRNPTPHVLIGDEAFALKPYLMKPFPYRQAREDPRKEHYNKRLCRARRVVENAFGILAQKWRAYYRPLEVKKETVIKIVQATCVLHNYLRTKPCDIECDEFLEATEPQIGALSDMKTDSRRAVQTAFTIREEFVHYFNN